MPIVLTYHEFKTVYLSSVLKRTHCGHSFRIYMFRNKVDLKTKAKIIENNYELYMCANSCNKFVSGRSWQIMKLLMILLCKGTCAPVATPFKGQGGSVPVMQPRYGVSDLKSDIFDAVTLSATFSRL